VVVKTWKKTNGFGTAPSRFRDPKPSGTAPRRVGPPQGPDPRYGLHDDDRRRVRKAQRAARRVTRARAS
jgi:hypothetical protein